MEAYQFKKTLLTTIKRVFQPRQNLSVSQWADRNRVLPVIAAERGKWRTERTPYLREPMDLVTDPSVSRITLCWGAQLGKTELLINTLLYYVVNDPCPMIMVQPTSGEARKFSKRRLAELVDDMPFLANYFRTGRADQIEHKKFYGGDLLIVSARSGSALRGQMAKILFLDEVDGYPAVVITSQKGQDEGSPVDLVMKRTTTFPGRKIIMTSTPTYVDGLMDQAFKQSDQRYYYVTCPNCSTEQHWTWERVIWDKDTNGDHLPLTARIVCSSGCGHEWHNSDRYQAIRDGEWRATKPFNGHAGYHLNALYSPWVSLTEMVTDFLSAKAQGTIKSFQNTRLALPWTEPTTPITDIHDLKLRAERYTPSTIPSGVVYITAGIDVQGNRIEGELLGWGANDETWSIDYFVIPGNTLEQPVWDQLSDVLTQKLVREDGVPLTVRLAAIDMGYAESQIKPKINLIKRRNRLNILLVRGASAVTAPITAPRLLASGICMVNPSLIKDRLQELLLITEDGGGSTPGYCHFPEHYDSTYYEQLLSEKPTTTYKMGVPVRRWILVKGNKKQIRNEALDCRVYAMAARLHMNLNVDREEERNQQSVRVAVESDKTKDAMTTTQKQSLETKILKEREANRRKSPSSGGFGGPNFDGYSPFGRRRF
ncbi:putative Bacteriophage tail assembly protein [Candidatus Defluviicoccus seviourii]|uniref:Bacteriophage tail assembly protein n=1 Tax=Candidatus Defluviicoccus seviourii TaxID=2565273 RepID=A0A564WH44_9PROT|nr:putative Bacteriophage tail assembly protein [Candidatus Defluviicoccus seviourii]